jgi:cell volume regulation protein A
MHHHAILIVSIILLFTVFIARISHRLNVPLIIIALVIGMFFGSDISGLIYFDDAALAVDFANMALIFILFAGGFGTKSHHFQPVAKPSMLLATAGVLLTALITGSVFAVFSGWPFINSLLLCTILSSTDAAAVFSILKTRSINRTVSSITEIESAANDPMAIVSVTLLLQVMTGNGINTASSVLLFIWQMAGGVCLGLLSGMAGTRLFNKIRNIDIGYYYVFLIGMILFSFGIADLCRASGMLSVFFSGYIFGNRKIPFKSGISSFAETLSFIANVGLFILLGLLVFPGQLTSVWLTSIMLFLIIVLIGRPAAVFLCTFFTGLTLKDRIFISWSGLRGAVPIVLATYAAARGIDNGHQIFNIVFLTVTLSIIVQGTTVGKLADLLKLTGKPVGKPGQTMELVTIHDTNYELIEILIDKDMYEGESMISQMPLPAGITITMINRDNVIIAPRGSTIIYPGDILSVLVNHENIKKVSGIIIGSFTRKQHTS